MTLASKYVISLAIVGTGVAALLLVSCSPDMGVPREPTALVLYATQHAWAGQQTALALEAAQKQAEAERARAEATAQYIIALRTATAYQATYQAQSLATERAWKQTAEAWSLTQTAAEAQATATQIAVLRQATVDAANAAALATAQAAQAGIAQEALRQERIRSERQDFAKYGYAVLPMVLLAVAIGLAAWGLVLYKDNRVLTQQADGRLVLLVDGRVVVPDNLPGPVVNPRQPPELTDGVLEIARRSQTVAAVRALMAGGAQAQGALVHQLAAGLDDSAHPQVRVIEPEQIEPLLRSVLPAIYQRALLEAENDQEEGK